MGLSVSVIQCNVIVVIIVSGIVEVDFLWNRTVDSLKISFHPLLWTSSGLEGIAERQHLYGERQAH